LGIRTFACLFSILIFSIVITQTAFAETVEFLNEDGQEELVSVFFSTNKETYFVGDDLEFTLTIDDPYQGEYSFWGTDPNNDYITFFNYKIKSSDGGGTTNYDIYPGLGAGITFQYFMGTSTVKIENFWTDNLPSGEYFIHVQLPNWISLDRYISFEKESNPQLPEWIRNTFVWYAEGVVTENEILNSIKYLVENNIIPIQKNQNAELEETIETLSQKINSLLDEVNTLNNKIRYLENENTLQKKENVELKTQLAELNQPQQDTQPQSYSPKTTEQKSSLNYPKVTKRIDGDNTHIMLAEFHDSLTTTEKNELVNRVVDQSQFTIVTVFAGNWILTVIEGNFDFIQYEGLATSVIPFDCSHNMEYIYSIVGQKEDETGKISLWLFKNGVLIDYDASEKPYGISSISGVCDEPSIVNSIG